MLWISNLMGVGQPGKFDMDRRRPCWAEFAAPQNGLCTTDYIQDLRDATNFCAGNRSSSKILVLQLLANRLPRPGVEPGLEVPETSVMSFSLPGLAAKQLI